MISLRVQTPPPLMLWCLVIGGSIALGVALWSGHASWRLLHESVRTTGTVIEMAKMSRDGSGRDLSLNDSWAPVFRFRDAAGKEHTVRSSFYRSPPAHRVGDAVPVVYSASAPEEARIHQFAYFWLMPTLSGGFAIFCWSIVALTVCRRLTSALNLGR
jgi:hypothetical protein